MRPAVTITSVRFRNFKALKEHSVSLQPLNILVGPNNCGKSTVLDAFRALEAAMRRARAKRAQPVVGPLGHALGYPVSEESLAILTENVHYDYVEADTTVTFRLSNANTLQLYFAPERGCVLIGETQGGTPRTPTAFKRQFPIAISVVPVLGPVEKEEQALIEDTVRRGLFTHRASRHFRNYWWYNADNFEAFAALVEKTWPSMRIHPPEKVDPLSGILSMFCTENGIDRELSWAGFGFQVWCQLLTHIVQATNANLLVVDEPEIYLHPQVQRQLVGILRDCGPDILMATHSAEIMGEAHHSELLLMDKSRKSAHRLNDIEGVQAALDAMGSIQNLTLTQLAKNRRLLFVEGDKDIKVLRRFAHRLGYSELSAGLDFTAVACEGFSSWERIKSLAWGFEKALDTRLHIGAVFDHDYWPEEQTEHILAELNEHLELAHIHERKEIENYLLCPAVLQRVLTKAVAERARRTGEEPADAPAVDGLLDEISQRLRSEIEAQYIAKRGEFFEHSRLDSATITRGALEAFEAKWCNLRERMELVPGKKVLSKLRSRLQSECQVNLTDYRIIDEFRPDEIPLDLRHLLASLEGFRQGDAGGTP